MIWPITDAFDCSSRKPIRRQFASGFPRALLFLSQEKSSGVEIALLGMRVRTNRSPNDVSTVTTRLQPGTDVQSNNEWNVETVFPPHQSTSFNKIERFSSYLFQCRSLQRTWGFPTTISKACALVIATLNRWKLIKPQKQRSNHRFTPACLNNPAMNFPASDVGFLRAPFQSNFRRFFWSAARKRTWPLPTLSKRPFW